MRIASIVALCLMVVAAPAQDVPNPGFEDGAAGDPDGWSLNQGTGAWEMDGRDGGRCISVTGGGDNEASNFWLTDDLVFKPGETYRISLWMKVALGTSGGTIMTGPSFANRDYGCGETWEEKSFVFAVPEEPGNSGYLRFGQWE
ncbi:MAG TPA: carbohydrate binding domain-containing protein, partial [Armatimonadota bacterium]|nr:carbohydrate binding domain-containing protein [Armatimonadota bacterium]